MQRNHVGGGEQRVERAGVFDAQLGGPVRRGVGVEGVHPHAERGCDTRHPAPDTAQSHQPQRLPLELHPLVPGEDVDTAGA